MGDAALRKGLTPEEYLAFERASEEKHEYADGQIFAVSGCSGAHSLITANIVAELRNALLEKPCEVYAPDMRVKIEASGRYVYPDASVVCGEPTFEDAKVDTLVNPNVIVEVLSESTERYDRGDKFAQYRSVPSISDYILVSQTEPRIEHFRRQPDGRWLLTIVGPGEVLVLESIGITIPVDGVYLNVKLPPPSNEPIARG